jgi:hypothetical protein
MALFGAPLSLADHCASAVRAAREMIEMAAQFSAEQLAQDKPAVRIGIVTGDVVAGYTGTNRDALDVSAHWPHWVSRVWSVLAREVLTIVQSFKSLQVVLNQV